MWFGEPLPRDAWGAAEKEARRADTMLVIGASGAVYPAARIPLIAKEHGALLVEVNVSETPLTPLADIHARGEAARMLGLVARHLGIDPL